ncbi:MAG TPA: N-acetylglucosamine-6-phosphate deacetylase [Mycobacteriales bacterium]|nr:N-acetylglucosamine-6-phosphate deacetylase [Mycobacteriales bacterium]
MILAGARVVTPTGVLDPGWLQIEDGRISAVGPGAPPTSGTDLGGAWVLPGYVDLHVHGGGGGSIDESAEGLATSVAFHRQHGTTRTLASLVTADADHMEAGIRWIAEAVRRGPGPDGHVVGAHLEGPFLSAARCGAQDTDAMLDPDPALLRRFLAAGPVRMVTVAPERAGGVEMVRQLAEAGVIPAIGHSDAHFPDAAAAVEAGARVVTHTFNGMRGLHHRDPGIAGVIGPSSLVCEAINDGEHLHDAVVRLLSRLVGDRLCFVTDAMAAAGIGDGSYRLGKREVRVENGKATLVETGSIAGSTLTMERAVARAVREVGLPIEVAARAAATTPARVLGGDFGALIPGYDADLVVLDDELAVTKVMAQGGWS